MFKEENKCCNLDDGVSKESERNLVKITGLSKYFLFFSLFAELFQAVLQGFLVHHQRFFKKIKLNRSLSQFYQHHHDFCNHYYYHYHLSKHQS